MRKIKFRAWDKQRMVIIDEALEIKNIGLGEGSVLVDEDAQKGGELIWMQYTGLKDKNDKEIYEGDIVVFPYDKTKAKHTVEWSDIILGYTSLTDTEEGVVNIHVEIVGNIYEDKD